MVVEGILRFQKQLMHMSWAFKLIFFVDILAFYGLETVWATFGKIGQFFFRILWSPWWLVIVKLLIKFKFA